MSKVRVTQIIKHSTTAAAWGFVIYGLGSDGQLYCWDFGEHEWRLA